MSTDSPQGPSSLVEQRRLCGIGGPSSQSLDLLEAKPPWEGDLDEKKIKQVKSALYDMASYVSTLQDRFIDTLNQMDERLMKVHSSAAGMQQYGKLKKVLKRMNRLEAELRSTQSEIENLAAQVK